MAVVSVVITTYERPQYLPGAIETALAQTYDDIEIVVVDDGSGTDYAADIVADYDGARLVAHEENCGPAAALNTGIDASDGEFVAFLDDDDRWQQTKLQRQIGALEARPEAGLASCLMISVRPDGSIITCQGSAPDGDLADLILVDNVIGSPSRVLVRREALAEYRFDESLPSKHDWDFYLRLCQEWDVVAVSEPLYIRLYHESMSSDPRMVEQNKRAVIDKHEANIRDRNLFDEAMAVYHTRVGRKSLEAGNRRLAISHLKRANQLEATAKRVVLLGIATFPSAVFSTVLRMRRHAAIRRYGCPDPESLAQTVEGYPPG